MLLIVFAVEFALPGRGTVRGLQLAGQGVTVILNGKVTTLSVEQLYTSLPCEALTTGRSPVIITSGRLW